MGWWGGGINNAVSPGNLTLQQRAVWNSKELFVCTTMPTASLFILDLASYHFLFAFMPGSTKYHCTDLPHPFQITSTVWTKKWSRNNRNVELLQPGQCFKVIHYNNIPHYTYTGCNLLGGMEGIYPPLYMMSLPLVIHVLLPGGIPPPPHTLI